MGSGMTKLQRAAASAVAGLVAAAALAWLLWPTTHCISTLVLPAHKNRKTCTNVLGLPANESLALGVSVVAGFAVAILLWRGLSRRASDA